MPSFDVCYKLHNVCSNHLIYDFNWEPRIRERGELRYDAHIVTTWKMAKAICLLFGNMDADKLSGVELCA